MKRKVILTLAAGALTLLPFSRSHAWETATQVEATRIGFLPYTITVPEQIPVESDAISPLNTFIYCAYRGHCGSR